MSNKSLSCVVLLDSRDPRAEPLLACYEAARMALVADYAEAESMTTEYLATEASVTLRVSGTPDRICGLLGQLYTLGMAGFVLEVSSDTDAVILSDHPAVGLVHRVDA